MIAEGFDKIQYDYADSVDYGPDSVDDYYKTQTQTEPPEDYGGPESAPEGTRYKPSILHALHPENYDTDDNDFYIAERFHFYLPEATTPERVLEFRNAVRFDDIMRVAEILEKILERPLTAVEKSLADRSVQQLHAWLLNTAKNQREHEKRGGLPGTPDMPLPPSAGAFQMHHERLNRNRRIAPFENILRDKMSGFILGLVLNAIEEVGNPDLEPVNETAEAFYQEALYTYQHVYVSGMHAFRAFAEWLRDNAPREGEFHVGRDTLTTLFVASNAVRWGKMSGRERAEAIRHVNISRSTQSNGATEETVKAFLEQEKINRYMLGVDGGFSGNGPLFVFQNLVPYFNRADADERIRIMGTHDQPQRLFDPYQNFDHLVNLMEDFPKFTDRSNDVLAAMHPVTKYRLSTPPRSVGDGVLAWVVQHAVWRDLCPKAEKLPDMTATELASVRDSKDGYRRSVQGRSHARYDRTKAHIKRHKKTEKPAKRSSRW